jgi:hypothetical protein
MDAEPAIALERAGQVADSLQSLAASADPSNGILSGFSLVWNGTAANPNLLQLQPGEAYVNGTQVIAAGATAVSAAGAGNNLVNRLALKADGVYYAYIVVNTQFAGGWMCLISDVAPGSDGIGPNLSKTINGVTLTGPSLFVGSILTAFTKNVVPFVRTGDEVVLNLSNNGCNAASLANGAGSNQYTYPGAGRSANFIMAPPQVVGGYASCDGTGGLGYPASASAMLIDFLAINTDPNNSYDFYIPPVTAIADANAQDNYQLYFSVPPGNTFLSYQTNTQRINVTTGPNPSFVLTAVVQPRTLTVWAIYRGYVEAISHLTPN